MIETLLRILKIVLPLIPFVLFAFLNMRANLKKELRSRQYLMPVFAFLYCVLILLLLNKIHGWLEYLLRALPNALNSAAGWVSGLADGKLSGVGDLLKSWSESLDNLLSRVPIVHILFYLENVLFLLVHIILKKLLLVFLKRICKPGRRLYEKVAGIFYDHEPEQEQWYLRKHYAQARTFLKTAYITAVVLTCIVSLVSLWLFRTGRLTGIFFPVFCVIVLGEICFFLGGLTKKELETEYEGVDAELEDGTDFRNMRDALRRLFGDKLAAEDTQVITDTGRVQSNDELLSALEDSDDPMLEAYGKFMRRKVGQGLVLDQNYLNTGRDLLHGKSVLFNNPFYYDLIPYIFYPMNRAMLRHQKTLIVLGRHETEQDIEQWCTEGLMAVTNLPTMWRIGVLDRTAQDLDVGIITRSAVHDLQLHEANRDFFAKVEFVVLIEPSRLVTTAQVGLNSLVRYCRAEDKQVTYCSTDKNCDGLVDALSHILMTNLTEVSATNKPQGLSSYMCWNPDEDLLQHRLLPNISRYLGVGTELAFAGLKNRAKRADWFGGDAFPVTDMHWISKQYYYDLLNYADRPTVQEGMDEYFHTTHNLWNARTEQNHYMVVEDESYNMFEIRRAFSTRAGGQGFVNVISQAYLLRDYMAENSGIFNTDPKAIPYIVADYAHTERNVVLRLCLRMAAGYVLEDEIRSEMLLVGLDTDRPLDSFWHGLCASFHSEDIPRTGEGEECMIFQIKGAPVRFTKDLVELKRKYCIETGKVENTYHIRNEQFIRTVVSDLENAGYIAEDEQGEQLYLGTELRGQVFQKYLPGQFFTLGGKYYEMLRATSDGRILVRRAADHITGRPAYRQVRRYTLSGCRDSQTMGDRLDISGMKVTRQFADLKVETGAFWELPDYNDFAHGHLVEVNGVPAREYRNKQVLRIELPEALNPTPEIYRTVTLLFNEVFRTLFAENQGFICAVTPGEAEMPLTYSLDCGEEGGCIYILEDSQLDVGLLEAVRRNLNRIFAIVSDYLQWHAEALEKSLNPPPEQAGEYPYTPQVTEEAPKKKRCWFIRMLIAIGNFFKRIGRAIANFFRRLFGRKKKEPKKPQGAEGAQTPTQEPGAAGEPVPETGVPEDGAPAPGAVPPAAPTADGKRDRAAEKAEKQAEKARRKAEKQAEKQRRKEEKARKKNGEPLPAPQPEQPAEPLPGQPDLQAPEQPAEAFIPNAQQPPAADPYAPQAAELLPQQPEPQTPEQPAEPFIPDSQQPLTAEPEQTSEDGFPTLMSVGGGRRMLFDEQEPAPEPAEPDAPTQVNTEGGDVVEFEPEQTVSPVSELKRKPYHQRYYLLYGGTEVPAQLDLAGTLELLRAMGYGNTALTQARINKGIAERIERSFVPNRAGASYCDFCGCELIGNEYERLSDGRERCMSCGKTAVKTAAEFQALYRDVHRNLASFYGARINVPIHVQMVNAKKLHRKLGKTFVPTGNADGRVLGVAIKDGKGYQILIENGAPRLQSIMTMAHEMTHIWQYLNWDARAISSAYGKADELEIYEGMAKWSEIQYAYLIGEPATAKREEIITRCRNDEYGRGFCRYATKYPLSMTTSLGSRPTPFTDKNKPL